MPHGKPRRRAPAKARPPAAGTALSAERIVEAALAQIAERGLERFSLRDVARALGVYPTAVYWYFRSRNELLAAVCAAAQRDIVPPPRQGDWQAWLGYKYVERDAVLDAFNDPDFHLGGTDAKGWFVGGSYGIAKNTSLRARYLSANEIDLPPLAIDVFQLDLTTKF